MLFRSKARGGLRYRPAAAPWFYAVFVGGIVIAMLVALMAPNPMGLLVPSQVLNGIVAVPLLIAVLVMSNSRRIVGPHTNGWLRNIAVGAAVLIMLVPSVLLLFLH